MDSVEEIDSSFFDGRFVFELDEIRLGIIRIISFVSCLVLSMSFYYCIYLGEERDIKASNAIIAGSNEVMVNSTVTRELTVKGVDQGKLSWTMI